MREKILAELNKKYLGLSKNVLGLLADKLVPKVTEESQIEGAIAALDNLPFTPQELATFVQKEGDARVTAALKKKPTDKPGDNVDPTIEQTPANANDPVIKLLTELTNTVKGMQQEKVQQTMTQKLHAKLAEKKIPLQLAKGRTIEKEEDLDALVTEIEGDWTTLKQENANAGFSATSSPAGGAGAATATDATAAAAEIKAWAEKNKPQVGATK